MENKLKVLVCGTTFGQFYIEALNRHSDKFELAGILAKGSERSKKCAEINDVLLYSTLDELPSDIDLACVVIRSGAIGGEGTQLTINLINKGISVIQEQPIHPKDLRDCYKASISKGVHFLTGDLYPNLNEVTKFIECARYLNKADDLIYVKAAFCPQVSYPAIDILSKAMPSIRNIELKSVINNCGPFEIFTGEFGGIPTVIEYQNYINPNDPDNFMHLLHSFCFIYNSGRLVLEDTFGPIIWHPRMHVASELYNRADVTDRYPEYLNEKTAELVEEYHPRSYAKVISAEWPRAIGKDLLYIRDLILKNKKPGQKAQNELLCSKQWSTMTKHFGYANLLNDSKHEYIDSSYLKHIIKEVNRKENEYGV